MKSLIVGRVGVAVLWVLGGGMVGGVVGGVAVVPATGPTTRASDEQQIRDVAKRVMDATSPFDAAVVDDVVTTTELERRFAAELLRSFRAERDMIGRCAAAAGGGAAAMMVKNADTNSRLAIESGKLVIDGDTATLEYKPSREVAILHFVRGEGRWRQELLKRYRERGNITEEGIARCIGRQRAAAATIELYEKGEEKNVATMQLVFESMASLLTPKVTGTPTTRP